MHEFAGNVAVVTGAASGLGRAFAERCAREGMRVVLADVEKAALDRAVDELRQPGYDVMGVRTDVSRLASVQSLARRTLKAYGKIHVVCNSARVDGHADPHRPIWEAAERDWLWTFGVNFWGVVHGTRTFMPIMLAQDEEAHLVNIASTNGLVRGGTISGITRHAVVALTETISDQLAQRETRVGVSVLSIGQPNARRRPNRDAPGDAPTPTSPAQVADLLLQGIKDRQLYLELPTYP